jgi:excinuclease ABC subunit C
MARPPTRVLAHFGPVPAGQRAREAVRRVNDWFGLRDCSQSQEMVFPDQVELFPVVRSAGCLRFEIGTCLGPCTGACPRSAYRERVQAAQAFLGGMGKTPLEILEREMAAASAALAFERAAALRDKRESLRWLFDHLERLRLARTNYSFIYPVRGDQGPDLWYLIHGGRTAAVVLCPCSADSLQIARAAIDKVFRETMVPADPLPPQDVDGLLLITGWFHRHPEERQRVLNLEEARRWCRSRERKWS